MKFAPTSIEGVVTVDLERLDDERGFFARSFCEDEFAEAGLETRFVQCSVSYNEHRGTLRGLHYQDDPWPEHKVVRCTAGAVFDVAVDLRPASPTFRQWVGVELSAENRRALYIPAGCAHGFETLEDHTEVFYMISERYRPELARGVRWDDPAIGIAWPIPSPIVSSRDAGHPPLGG